MSMFVGTLLWSWLVVHVFRLLCPHPHALTSRYFVVLFVWVALCLCFLFVALLLRMEWIQSRQEKKRVSQQREQSLWLLSLSPKNRTTTWIRCLISVISYPEIFDETTETMTVWRHACLASCVTLIAWHDLSGWFEWRKILFLFLK